MMRVARDLNARDEGDRLYARLTWNAVVGEKVEIADEDELDWVCDATVAEIDHEKGFVYFDWDSESFSKRPLDVRAS